MGIYSSRSLNPEITSRSGRYDSSEITSTSGQYHHIKVPDTPPLLPTKSKGPLYDSHLAHTAYMNNVARARRSTGTPHYSQLLKPQHLVRRKSASPFVQHKKTTSPVRCILTSHNGVSRESINYENMDLLSTDHNAPKDKNCGVVEESTSDIIVNAKSYPLQTICNISDKASSGFNADRTNTDSFLAPNTLSHESGTSPEAQQKDGVQHLNQEIQPAFALPPNDDANSRINDRNSALNNNGDLRLLHRNNATQTSPSPSRISNLSSNSYDDSELMKSLKFPHETAVFYMMHSEEFSQEFSVKKRHGFCRDFSTAEDTSPPSLSSRDIRSSQKRRQSKYIALEFEKEFHHPLKAGQVHYQEAEKPLIHDVIKEESAERIESGRTLNSGDGAEASVEIETYCEPEKRSYDLENVSLLERNDTQRNLTNNDTVPTHSELGVSELPDENPVTKVLSPQELVSSDHSGILSWHSCEYRSKGAENDMKGKPEDSKTNTLPTRRRFSELNIPVDKVFHEPQLRRHSGPRRIKPASLGPDVTLTKFHAHGDGFVRPQQYLAETFCCTQEEELEPSGLLVGSREGTIARHRSRHERSRNAVPPCPPSTPCSGVYSTENIKSEIVNAEPIEDFPLLMGCMVRSQRKPTSPPTINNQEKIIGEPHSKRAVIPEETTDIDDDYNKYTNLKHAPPLRIYARFRSDDENSTRDVAYEETNKLHSDFAYSDDEPKQNTTKKRGMHSAGMERCAEQMPVTTTPRTSPKEARSMKGSAVVKASEFVESASAKLMKISAEYKDQQYSNSSAMQKESSCRQLLMNEPQAKYKTYEAKESSLCKNNISENENIKKLGLDTQEAVSQYDTEKSKKKQDEKKNTCYNQYANSEKPFLAEIQRQRETRNEACTSNFSKDKSKKSSVVWKYSEQQSYLEKSLRKNLQSNTSSESRGVQHETDHHRHSPAPEAPQREISVNHCQVMRESTTSDVPHNFRVPSPQFAQTVVDTHSSLHQKKRHVSQKYYQPEHDAQHQNIVHQYPERDDEERIFHQQHHTSRARYCPKHGQRFDPLQDEEGLIPSLNTMDADERYHHRHHHLQPRQHYCKIHHRVFTMDMLPHELHLLHKAKIQPESDDSSSGETPSQNMNEDLSDHPKRNLSSLAPRCRSLVTMFERQKHVVLSGRNKKIEEEEDDEEEEEENISAAMNGVNGVNGHHGELNGGGDLINSQNTKGCWTIGLINSKFRYLTAETFGFKINANGASLKKKQVWTLEPASGDSAILLRSHLDKYLAVDTFGNVTCETEERDDPGTKFQISVADDGTGRWALRNITRGYFLGASSDKLTCTAKVPGDAELWHVHLAARPQVNLRSVGRKRFAHLSENLDEIHVDANIPWGEDTLFTLEFRADDNGKYALHTCNNKYLSREGKLVDTCTPNCLFSAEYHAGQLALRDRTGAYLSPIGSKAVLKSRSTTVTKDELFSLEDSLPQASFVAGLNSRYVSVKQGVDVTANQDEISDHETFQLEFDSSTKRWYIRTMQDRYWTLETGGGIQASGDKRSSNALFDLVWQRDGSVAFRANNGKFVSTKRSGHLYANCDNVEDNSKYFFYLINRPILVLKCEQGFVGYKSATSPKLECNKATYETIQVERSEKGIVFFKGQNGKYWHVDGESVTADSDTPEGFFIELRDPTHICIKSTSGEYLVASKNGAFRLGDSDYENATKWEY